MPQMTRRTFLAGCSAAVAAMAGARLNRVVFGSPEQEPNQDILIVVFLRGGCDVLSLVTPIAGADRGYFETARPDLQFPVNQALPLNAQFGLHPSAVGLHTLFGANQLAIVQAAGMDEDTRSHFDAMAYMELGTPGNKSTTTGWLARHLSSADNLPVSMMMPAFSAGSAQPTAFLGDNDVAALDDVDSFKLNTGPWEWRSAQRLALRHLYNGGNQLQLAGTKALDTVDIIETQAGGGYTPSNGAVYPDSDFGDQLQLVAQMIKLQLGLQAVSIDLGGWDTHEGQANSDPIDGYFADLTANLSDGLTALYTDLDGSGSQDYMQRTTVVVMSEFGRRLRENGNRGTDHGHGGMMLALGGKVNGGLYGVWPGLAPNQLYDGADLAVTTDYRQLLSEILIRRLANPRLGVIFPGYTNYMPLGIMQGVDLPPNYDPPMGENQLYLPAVMK